MVPNLTGYWKMISNDNFEEYLKALGEFISSAGSQAQRRKAQITNVQLEKAMMKL